MCRIAALSLAAGVLLAFVFVAATPAYSQSPGTVSGVVTDSGVPIAGVSLTVRDSDGAKVAGAFTGVDGTYSIAVSEPGTYTVDVDPQTLPEGVAIPDDELVVEFDLGVEGAVVDFAAGAADAAEGVRGRLRFPNPDTGENDPVAGAEIFATDPSGTEVGRTTSADDGTWQLALPGPGTYTIRLDADTLPEGVGLRSEGADVRTLGFSSGQVRTLSFPLGDRQRDAKDSLYERGVRLFFDGLNYGLIIAICAIGLSLIFGTTGLTNFSHGELVTFGAVIGYMFNVTVGWHILLVAPVAIVIGGVFGAAQDLALWRPLRRRGVGLNTAMIVSIGLGLFLRYVILYQFRGDARKFAQYQIQPDGLSIGPATISPKDLWSMGIAAAVLVGVALMLQRTRIGKAMRAVSDNRDLAAASGIDVQRVILTVWVLGGALAALGGLLLGLDEDITWDMGFRLLLLMFAGVTLGGLGTAYGALVGSILVGEFVILSTLWIKPELKNVGALAALILVLLVRPQGILGQKERVG
jgi:branched-chain amino acid transport system permease protein